MVRRKFLTMLGMAPLVIKAEPLLNLAPAHVPVHATISEYADFVSISEVASDTVLDPVIVAAIDEWTRRETQRLDRLIDLEFGYA